MKTIAIIGAGAAGMMAAVKIVENLPESMGRGAATREGTAPRDGSPDAVRVLLFEKNAYSGAKVLISGGGRCNVTTGILDVREMLKNYPRGSKFLMTAMYHFPPEKVMQWFRSHGVPLKIEEDLRVFPASDNGKDVVGALEAAMKAGGVEVMCNSGVVQIEKSQADASISSTDLATANAVFKIQLKDGSTYLADFLILTTGGNAYLQTGSTGDGYAFAKNLGHTITPLGPSLNSFTTDASWISSLAGVSIERAKLSLNSFERVGAFVFTHRGVSGPAVFALSSFAAFEKITKEHSKELHIHFFPDESRESVEKKFDDLIEKNPKKKVENVLDVLLPKSLCRVVVDRLNLQGSLTATHLNRAKRHEICALLGDFSMNIVGRAAGEEFVTAGGISTDEVNTNTMESKICKNLYFAGEILDEDGFTGGFNLQASWATGALAGEHVAKQIVLGRVRPGSIES